jgi:hypothetical protein
MKTCVLFNIINHRQDHRNVTSQILPVCLPLKADVLAVSIEKYSFDVYYCIEYVKTSHNAY